MKRTTGRTRATYCMDYVHCMCIDKCMQEKWICNSMYRRQDYKNLIYNIVIVWFWLLMFFILVKFFYSCLFFLSFRDRIHFYRSNFERLLVPKGDIENSNFDQKSLSWSKNTNIVLSYYLCFQNSNFCEKLNTFLHKGVKYLRHWISEVSWFSFMFDIENILGTSTLKPNY